MKGLFLKHLKPAEHYGDIYQDVCVDGKVVYPGWRDCDTRWNIIKPHILPNPVVMDLGSNAGYFSQKIAEEVENSLVWSMEYVPGRFELQRDMLLENETPNVVLTQRKMDLFSFLKIQNSVNRVDVILALNVLEYFSPDELFAIMGALSRISPTLIVEFPGLEETGAAACAGTLAEIHPIDTYLKQFYQYVKIIGRATASTDRSLKRDIYYCANPRIYAERLLGYITKEGIEAGGRRHTLGYEGGREKWVLNGSLDFSKGAPALNLCNLVYFGLVYPNAESLFPQIEKAYRAAAEEFGTITDIHLRNVLYTPEGARVIDCLEHYAKAFVYGRARDGDDGFEAIFPAYLERALTQIKTDLESGVVG